MAGNSSGWFVSLYTEARARLLRVMGLASRRDILATQERIDKLFREHRRAADTDEAQRRRLNELLSCLDQVQTQLGGPTRGMDGRLRHVERNV
ncbi:MAG TPA: hypothetical protein EYQ83_13795, partial [Acidobacteria bacterium]|nr:hypothetical protein [Acidobacteriota bacterium]